jgi:branched-chain amino acid transport system substrate-binding protein
MMRRKLFVAALVAGGAMMTVALPNAFGRALTDPGITARTVTIGGTFPLSGPASSYAPIPAGMKAYFSYVNASRGPDHKRGVGGRQIIFKYYDDAYNPALTVQYTRQLVEQDKVFALVGGLGTSQQEAVRSYANQMKVPQIYVSTGATEFGAEQAQYPWTIGWQPDYQAESAVYGRYIAANFPNAKIGILYQNDDFGKDYIAGLNSGLTKAHQNLIVATRSYEPTDTSVTSQLLDLRAAGVDTLLIAALPTQTIVAYATMAGMGWKPANIFTTSVSATSTFLPIAVSKAGAAEVNGTISTYYTKDPANPSWAKDPGMMLYMKIMAKYLPGADATNGNYLYGMAKAYTFVQALRAAGPNPTRASLMAAVLHMNDKTNPFLLPGVVTKTGKNDPFPISQQQLVRWQDGAFIPFGKLIDTRPKGLSY